MKKQHLACAVLLCTILWAGCSGKKAHQEISAADTTASFTSTDTLFKTAKLVKTADMHFKVKNVKAVSENVSALTAKYNGMVIHHRMQSYINKSENVPQGSDSVLLISSCTTNAQMTVRIPATRIDEFLNLVSKMTVYVNSRNMDIEDKTFDYLSAQMKLISRKDMIAQQKTGKIAIKNPAAVMDLKDDMIDQQINNKRIDDAVKFSTIYLSFYQSNTITKEVVINDDPSDFRLPFFTRLGQSIANGWVIFANAIIEVANLWVFIVAIAGIWVAYRYHKRKTTIAV